MAPSQAKVPSGAFLLRLASAAVMAPAIVLAVHLGKPVFEGVIVLLGGLLAWEWSRLCGGPRHTRTAVVTIAAVAAVVAAEAVGGWTALPLALTVPAGLAAVAASSFADLGARRGRGEVALASHPVWSVGGYVYIGLVCAALVWIRADPEWGRATIYWLFAVVWASDTFAYLTGRAIGGPKLAPAISPGKTWAGFFGGAVFAGLAGGLAGWAAGVAAPVALGVASVAVGIVSQMGDLFESWMKRRFKVKDSGNIIPGHGGLFDRVDGLMAAGVAAGAVMVLGGRNVLAWF